MANHCHKLVCGLATQYEVAIRAHKVFVIFNVILLAARNHFVAIKITVGKVILFVSVLAGGCAGLAACHHVVGHFLASLARAFDISTRPAGRFKFFGFRQGPS